MKVYNTLARRLEEFRPLEENHVRMYTCGPTVYNYAHIGNFRAYVFEDLLRRYLKYHGYRVTQVMNLTDVDDKTIRGSMETGMPLDAFTQKYKDAFFEDLKILNIESAEQYPAATGHVEDMIGLIRRLFDKGYAYKSDDGSVYFSIVKFKGYGELAHLDMSGLRAGARVKQDEYDKENVADFALWKAWDEDDGDVAWESPWGKGRPGWHIECSAMSMKYLGESFDIHTGGVDNIFPHHEDEIAQSEAATGKQFAKYWMHCGYLVVDGKKMSKSLGNFHTLRQILDRGYSGREVRYVLIAGHYRQALNFTFSAMEAARAALGRVDEFMQRLEDITEERRKRGERSSGAADTGDLPEWAENARERFESALDNDLNVPEALAGLFDMIHDGNKAMDASDSMDIDAERVVELVSRFDGVLGLLGHAEHIAGAEIMALAAERDAARKARDWEVSDRIRNRLGEMGWEVRDTPAGAKVKRIRE